MQIGGELGPQFPLEKGDVLIIPAGVSHKNLGSSSDFECVGSYPLDIEYDMNYGKPDERPMSDEKIKQVPLPKIDPVYGSKGPLLEYWQS